MIVTCYDGLQIRQRHVEWMREMSDAPAWDTAEVPADFHTVDPSSLVLTADCATPVASSSRKRASSTMRDSASVLGSSQCSSAGHWNGPSAGHNGYTFNFASD